MLIALRTLKRSYRASRESWKQGRRRQQLNSPAHHDRPKNSKAAAAFGIRATTRVLSTFLCLLTLTYVVFHIQLFFKSSHNKSLVVPAAILPRPGVHAASSKQRADDDDDDRDLEGDDNDNNDGKVDANEGPDDNDNGKNNNGDDDDDDDTESSDSMDEHQLKKKPGPLPIAPLVFENSTKSYDTTSFDTPFDSHSSLPVVYFYNIYIQSKKMYKFAPKYGRMIVREQLRQVGDALSAMASNKNKTINVFYNTIGAKGVLDHEKIRDLCWTRYRMQCHHMQHYSNAFEEVTLQRLYEFCHDHPSFRVVYMHSKGSFHHKRKQRPWRHSMMKAVTHPDCLLSDSACNVCGASFVPIWVPMVPGNIWAAKCSYVSQLVPPDNMDQTWTQLRERYEESKLNGRLTSRLYDEGSWSLGTDRYTSEHWIGSHPSIIPCTVQANYDTGQLEWSLEPQKPLADPWHGWHALKRSNLKKVMKHPSRRQQEYFLLPGNLFRWILLYNQVPPVSSWAWKWFPDGAEWKQLAHEERYAQNVTQLLERLGDDNLLPNLDAIKIPRLKPWPERHEREVRIEKLRRIAP